MSSDPRLTVRGLGPGESPVVVIVVPLDGRHEALVNRLVSTMEPRGNEPIAPLTTRGGRG